MVRKREFDFISENVIVLYDDIFPLYIVTGEKNFLIDSGVTAKAGLFYERINSVLSELGGSGKIDTLLLTHSHWDHAGAASWLQKKYGFDIYGSHRTVELLGKQKVVDFINRLNQDFKMMLGEKSSGENSGSAFTMPEKLIGVGDGQRIEISPGKYFEVIETPGHTKCSISYLLQPGGILFQGDSAGIIEKDRSIKPLFLSGYGDSKTSIKKLLALEAEALAFPHNRCIRGKTRVETHLKSALARMEELKDKIIRLLEGGKNVIGIAELIHDEDFPNPTLLGPREARTINFEALVKVVSKEFNIEPRK